MHNIVHTHIHTYFKIHTIENNYFFSSLLLTNNNVFVNGRTDVKFKLAFELYQYFAKF